MGGGGKIPKSKKSQNPKIQKSKNQRSRGMRLHRQTGLEATGVQRPPARGLGGLRPICCQPSGSPGAAPELCVEVARASGCVFDSCAQLLVVPPFATNCQYFDLETDDCQCFDLETDNEVPDDPIPLQWSQAVQAFCETDTDPLLLTHCLISTEDGTKHGSTRHKRRW